MTVQVPHLQVQKMSPHWIQRDEQRRAAMKWPPYLEEAQAIREKVQSVELGRTDFEDGAKVSELFKVTIRRLLSPYCARFARVRRKKTITTLLPMVAIFLEWYGRFRVGVVGFGQWPCRGAFSL